MTIPPELLALFKRTSFCPHDVIPGHPGAAWNTLRIEYDPGSESEYPSSLMFYDYHNDEGRTVAATKPFADWGRRADAEFVKGVIDWLQGMTQAGRAAIGGAK